MTIKVSENPFLIFDLDDTLFPEMDFLKSAFKEISSYISERTEYDVYDAMIQRYSQRKDVFKWIVDNYDSKIPECNVQFLLKMYRNHVPKLQLNNETFTFLEALFDKKIKMGLITDGRSITQRNKLRALKLEGYFTDIIISEEFGSEKPSINNYLFFEKKYPGYTFYYIGDNISKDFIAPAQLGWRTICLKDKGYNIHSQNESSISRDLKVVESLHEIEII